MNIEFLYEKELELQEERSNRFALRCFLVFFLICMLVWLLTVFGIFDIPVLPIHITFLIATITSLVPTVIFVKRDMTKKYIKYILLSSMCISCGAITSVVSVHAVFLYVLPLIIAFQYQNKKVLWHTFFMNGITMLISTFLSFYYGICDLNMYVVSNHTFSWYQEHYHEGALQIALNTDYNRLLVLFAFFPRWLILIGFTVMMSTAVKSHQKDVRNIAMLTYSKGIDASTEIYNKNKYEEMLQGYYPEVKNVAVLFWDLNNLKKINDTRGHDAGDVMIAQFAKVLRLQQTERILSYRIGGDEFVTIIENPVFKEAEQVQENCLNILGEFQVYEEYPLSCASGYAYGEGKEITQVVKHADEKMYENKRKQKESALHSKGI